jgi:polyhydroxyalkanoate synthesis regulator phasin
MSDDSNNWWTKKYQLGKPTDWSSVGDWWNNHGGLVGVINDYAVKPASTGLGAAFNKADAFLTGSSGSAPAQKGAGTQRSVGGWTQLPDGNWMPPTAPPTPSTAPTILPPVDTAITPEEFDKRLDERTPKAGWYADGTPIGDTPYEAPGRSTEAAPLTPEQQMQADIAAEQARIDAEYGKMATDLGSQFVYNEDPAERARKEQALGTISAQGKSAQKAIDDAYKAGIISSQEAAAASQQVRNEQAQYLGSLLTQSGDKIREMNSKVNTHYADQYGSVGAMNPSMGAADDLAALMYRTAPVSYTHLTLPTKLL